MTTSDQEKFIDQLDAKLHQTASLKCQSVGGLLKAFANINLNYAPRALPPLQSTPAPMLPSLQAYNNLRIVLNILLYTPHREAGVHLTWCGL